MLGSVPETRNTIVSKSTMVSIPKGEILEKIMNKNNRMTYLIILMFVFVNL